MPSTPDTPDPLLNPPDRELLRALAGICRTVGTAITDAGDALNTYLVAVATDDPPVEPQDPPADPPPPPPPPPDPVPQEPIEDPPAPIEPPVEPLVVAPLRAWGVCLSQNQDWSAPYTLDHAKQSRFPMGGGPWGVWDDRPLAMSADGWALPATEGDVARYLIGYNDVANPPTLLPGQYLLTFRSDSPLGNRVVLDDLLTPGRRELVSDTVSADGRERRVVIQYREPGPGTRGMIVTIAGPSPAPVRFQVVRVDHLHLPTLWLPEFLEALQPMRVVRMVWWSGAITERDWSTVGPNPETEAPEPMHFWSDRTRMEHASWTYGQVPWEAQLDLARHANVVPWLVVPARTDGGYIDRLADLIAEEYPQGHVIVELSNEVWNTTYRAHAHFERQGRTLFPNETNGHRRALLAYGYLSVEMAAHLAARLGTRVRVPLCGQADAVQLDALDAPATLDVIGEGARAHAAWDELRPLLAFGTAPYFGAWTMTHPPAVQELRDGGLNALWPMLESSVTTVRAQLEAAWATARRWGLPHFIYEGGQHMVAPGTPTGPDPVLHRIATEANAHPRMRELYARFWQGMMEPGRSSVVTGFSLVDPTAPSGHWGLYRAWGDPSGKLLAYLAEAAIANRTAQRLPQSVPLTPPF